MRLLKIGSTGDDVKDVQAELNVWLDPSPNLVPDGIYGALTAAAVRRFQAKYWLVVDGQAGPCTQNCLFGNETYSPILHNIAALAQPTQTTCWATSTAMIKKTTVPDIIARTPANLIASDGGLLNSSETDNPDTTGVPYSNAHNLSYFRPMSWMMSALRRQLEHGPLMFDMLWDVVGYTTRTPTGYQGSPGHMIVVVGMRGDDDESGIGTTLRIHDPWPPNASPPSVYSQGFMRWMNEVPTRTYRVFQAMSTATIGVE